jgi:cysteinyl-tRNA synthetase
MSKSLGNVFLIDQLLERFDALTLRHFLVSAHYRSPLTFSGENLHASRAATRRLLEALARARRVSRRRGGRRRGCERRHRRRL